MIPVTRLDNSTILLNVDRIQSVQAVPDTIITFTNNDCLRVKEPLDEVSQRIVDYQRSINQSPVVDPCFFQEAPQMLH